jgi:hypothetical protein
MSESGEAMAHGVGGYSFKYKSKQWSLCRKEAKPVDKFLFRGGERSVQGCVWY